MSQTNYTAPFAEERLLHASSQSLLSSKASYILIILSVLVLVQLLNKKPLPAGTKRLPRLPGLPWLGRFWGLPSTGSGIAWFFAGLHKTYGPIFEWKVMGVNHVWIGKDSIARDLLVKRGKLYGDRHEIPAALGIKGGSEILPLMGIGDNFWRHRNFTHAIMRESSLQLFYDAPVVENKLTLRRMLESPDRWSENFVTHASRTIARIAWGDPLHATKLLTVVPTLLHAISPGAGPLPNVLPFLQYIPAAISPYKKAEAKRRQIMQDAFYDALEQTKASVEAGTAGESWTKIWLEKNIEKGKLNYHEAAHAIGSNSLVAIATIGSPLHAFITAMCLYPSWLQKLQEEVDRVVGEDRLPAYSDVPNLPVMRAVMKEVVRWRQAVPGGVPHITTEDDVYNGYFIPKGSMVHANHFAMSRNEEMYPHANDFHPERYLEASWPTYKEPLTEYPNLRGDIAFGYGVRTCPGMDLTMVELYTLIPALVWAFDIKRPEGRIGVDNPVPWYEVNPYVITMSRPFPIDMKVRSEAKARFIRAGCPEDDGALVKQRRKDSGAGGGDRWAVYAEDGGDYIWGGLTAPIPAPPRSYSPAV